MHKKRYTDETWIMYAKWFKSYEQNTELSSGTLAETRCMSPTIVLNKKPFLTKF